LAQTFNIRGIPNLMIFREQIAIFQEAGSLPAEALTELLQQVRDIDMSDVRTQIAAAAAPAAEEPADEEPADDA
jgi:thioredoxin-like negative regulator of GroEL